MEDLASAMFDNEEAIQISKGECWDGEDIHGRGDLAVIAQEGSPGLSCPVGRSQAPDVARDRTFGGIEAEFEKLTVNSWGAPSRTL
jgi:hypothetical protein